MGVKLPEILTGAGINWTEIDSQEDIRRIDPLLSDVYSKNLVHAFLMSPAVWEGSECGNKSSEFKVRRREQTISEVQSFDTVANPI